VLVPAEAARTKLPIVALLVANCVSLIGSSLTMIAIPWFVLTTTGSATQAGLTGAFASLPAFLSGILGGAVVDRIGPRSSALVADAVSGVSILLIPLLYHTRGLAFWQLLLLVLCSAALEIPGLSARRSMLPGLAELGGIRLERVNSILESNQHLAFFLGPPLAGVLIAAMGTSNVLWIDAGSYFFSAAAIVLAVPRLAKTASRMVSRGYLTDIKDGLTWLWRDQVVRAISLGLCFTNAFGAPFFSLIFAVWAKDRFNDARYLGVMLSAYSVGTLVGSVAFGVVGHRFSRRRIVTVFFATVTLAYWPLAFHTPFWLILCLFAIGGFCDGPVNPLLTTVRMERIPEELRGRVFSATSAIAQLLPALTIPIAGLMIGQFGLRTTVVVIATIAQGVALFMLTRPIWKRLDESRPGRIAS
jgi:MFS family permease